MNAGSSSLEGAYRSLAAAIIVRAIRDLSDSGKQHEAAAWLACEGDALAAMLDINLDLDTIIQQREKRREDRKSRQSNHHRSRRRTAARSRQ